MAGCAKTANSDAGADGQRFIILGEWYSRVRWPQRSGRRSAAEACAPEGPWMPIRFPIG